MFSVAGRRRPGLRCPHSLHGDPELHGVVGLGCAGPHELDEEVGAEDAELGVAQLVQRVPVREKFMSTPNARSTVLQEHPQQAPVAPCSPCGAAQSLAPRTNSG